MLAGSEASKYETKTTCGLSSLHIILIAVAGAVGLFLMLLACCCVSKITRTQCVTPKIAENISIQFSSDWSLEKIEHVLVRKSSIHVIHFSSDFHTVPRNFSKTCVSVLCTLVRMDGWRGFHSKGRNRHPRDGVNHSRRCQLN